MSERLDQVTNSDEQNVSFQERCHLLMFEQRRQLKNFFAFSLGRFLFQICQIESQKLQLTRNFDQFFDNTAVNVPLILKANRKSYAIIPKLIFFYVFAAGAVEKNAKTERQFKGAKETKENLSNLGASICDIVLFKCQQ